MALASHLPPPHIPVHKSQSSAIVSIKKNKKTMSGYHSSGHHHDRQRRPSSSSTSSSHYYDRDAKRQKRHHDDDDDQGEGGNQSAVIVTGFESWWTETHLIDFLSYAMNGKKLVCHGGNPVISCSIFRAEETAYVELRCPAEAKNALQLHSTEVNGCTLHIQPWSGTRHWRQKDRDHDHDRPSSDCDDDRYEEYKTGKMLLIWSKESVGWKKKKMLENLNKELRIYGTNNAVIDAYKDSPRWVIKVVNSDLAMKLRKKLWCTRSWWIYGFEQNADSSNENPSHEASPPPEKKFGSPDSSWKTPVTLYIRTPSSFVHHKPWLLGYINSRMRQECNFSGDAIIAATATKVKHCWTAEVANDSVARKVQGLFANFGDWLVSATDEDLNKATTDSARRKEKGSSDSASKTRTTLHILTPPSCPSTKAWLLGYINGRMRREWSFSGDAIVHAAETKMESCWTAEIANDYAARKVQTMFVNSRGWLVSLEPLTTDSIEAGLSKKREILYTRPTAKQGEDPKLGVMVFQRPRICTDAKELVSFVNDHVEKNGLCPSESCPVVVSATAKNADKLETCWILQTASEVARDAIIGLDNVGFESSTLSFHKFVNLSFNKGDDQQHPNESSLTGKSRAESNSEVCGSPQPDTVLSSRAQPKSGTRPASRSEGKASDMEESADETTDVSTGNSKKKRFEAARVGGSNTEASKANNIKNEPSSLKNTTATDDVARKDTEYKGNENTGQRDCPISFLDDDESSVDERAAATTESKQPPTPPVEVNQASPSLEGEPQSVTPATAQRPGKSAAHLLHHAQKLAEQAKQEATENRLRKELGHATSQFIKQMERVRELELENQALKQTANNSQLMLQAQQTAATSAIQEMKLANSEAAAATAKLATIEGQLHAVHKDWQEQFNQIEEMKLQLQAQQAEIEFERSIREDTERRYRDVTGSLTLQTTELAKERRVRQSLEQYLVKDREN
jgi:hypothetical protein